MPTHDPQDAWLGEAIESVRDQYYDNWELCIVDDGPIGSEWHARLGSYVAAEARIRWVPLGHPQGPSSAINTALTHVSGEFVAFVEQHDVLGPDALLEVVRRLNIKPDLDLIYTDEDRVDSQGYRRDPLFKPDWSPDLLYSYNYIGHLVVCRRKSIRVVGGFASEPDICPEYDLVLRVTEQSDRIAHIARPLYSSRVPDNYGSKEPSPSDRLVGRNTVAAALARRGVVGEVVDGRAAGTYRVRYPIQGEPLVSIIIPTRDNVSLLRCCLESLRQRTEYGNYEILVVDNGSVEEDTLQYLAMVERELGVRVLEVPGSFNFSRICNLGVDHANGEHVLLLNDDTELTDGGWLEAMLEHSQRKEVGAVGARLLYPDGSVQHAGVIAGLYGTAGHAHRMLPKDELGYMYRASVIQNFSAVTAACLLTRKAVFQEIGGFDETNLTQGFGDHDYCFRVRDRGLLIVWTPHAELLHHESATRGQDIAHESRARAVRETAYLHRRWPDFLANDPYYNPNLTLETEDFGLRLNGEIGHLAALREKDAMIVELMTVVEQRRELLETNRAALGDLHGQLESKDVAIRELHSAAQGNELRYLDAVSAKDAMIVDLKAAAEQRLALLETNHSALLDLQRRLESNDVTIRELHFAAQENERRYFDASRAKDAMIRELKPIADQRAEALEAKHSTLLGLHAQLESRELAIRELHSTLQESERLYVDDLRARDATIAELKYICGKRGDLRAINRESVLDRREHLKGRGEDR